MRHFQATTAWATSAETTLVRPIRTATAFSSCRAGWMTPEVTALSMPTEVWRFLQTEHRAFLAKGIYPAGVRQRRDPKHELESPTFYLTERCVSKT